VGLDELKRSTPPGTRKKPAMFLSFDDGLSEIYQIVSPLLIAKGIPAGIFVNTGFIDNRDLFYRYKSSLILERLETIAYSPAITEVLSSRYHLAGNSKNSIRDFLLNISYKNRKELDEIAALVELDFKSFLKVKKPYMTLSQLEELAEKGFYIGSHSIDHPRFSEIDPGERLRQYRESMEFIHRELGTIYGIFSFPFRDDGVPGKFFKDIRKKGMPRLDASFGTAGLKNDPLPFHHHRIQMETGKVPAGRYIRGEYMYYIAKRPVKKNEFHRP
jgi:peptidoglycan/xylan/chitin deacetylase (PgdA/CDA1 family)